MIRRTFTVKCPIELRIEMIFFASKIQYNTKTESQSKILPDMNLYNDFYSHNLYLAYSNSSLCQIKFTDLLGNEFHITILLIDRFLL